MSTEFSRGFGTVIFDCDSTLSAIEGIEELASEHRAEVAALTESAMRGEILLEDVYARRLRLASPTRQRITALGNLYVQRMVEDAREVCAALAAESVDVRVVSGGLRPAVLAIARQIGIPDAKVAAVDIFFDGDGSYLGFDVASPLARSGGKCTVVQSWLPALPRPIMMVGDGSTDLEVRPLVDLFVAYAGVVDRANVTASADVVVRSSSLAPVFALALGQRTPSGSSAAILKEKGLGLLNRMEG